MDSWKSDKSSSYEVMGFCEWSLSLVTAIAIPARMLPKTPRLRPPAGVGLYTPGSPMHREEKIERRSERARGARRQLHRRLRRLLAIEDADAADQQIEQVHGERGADETRPEVLVVANRLARGIEDRLRVGIHAAAG